jgi:hypothetical protein
VDDRQRRLAQNEALYREVNERISAQAREQLAGDEDHLYEFICECSNIDCNLLLGLPLAEYERVRANAQRFIVAPGHHLPDIERLIDEHSGYAVVEKEGEAGDLAERLDPR